MRKSPFSVLASSLLLLSGLLLPTCSPLLPASLLAATTNPTTPPLVTAIPATITVAGSPTLAVTLTETPTQIPMLTQTPTPLPSATPTETHIPIVYVFPLEPADLADFADGLASHGYPATDIFAPEGTKFVAVTAGVVDFVSYEDTWDPATDDPAVRGGLSVAIIGDDGVRYYGSHLSAIASGIQPGLRVSAGQALGYVGHTGDARLTDSHLHFGISAPTYPEDWKARRGQVDPYAILLGWRAGQSLTPPLPTP